MMKRKRGRKDLYSRFCFGGNLFAFGFGFFANFMVELEKRCALMDVRAHW